MKLASLAVIATLFVVAFASAASASGGLSEWLTGDADCNERVNAIDAAIILQWDVRLTEQLACFEAADANNDFAANSLDAALVLQSDVGLFSGLAVHEQELCAQGGFKAQLGDLDQTIDLNGDGTLERVTIALDTVRALTVFTLFEYDTGSETYQMVQQETLAGSRSAGPTGPYTSVAAADINGDGREEAILCSVLWGANDPFTDAVVFSYESGTSSTIFRAEWVSWMFLSIEGSELVLTSRVDWYVGDCERITTNYYHWSGTELGLIRTVTTERFRSPDCVP